MTLEMHSYDHGGGPGTDPGVDTLRLWMSDQQWLSLLERIAREASEYRGPERREEDEPRYANEMHCVLRLGHPGQTPGTYLVRCRNISTGGLGFVHGCYIEPGTRCALALQADDGAGCLVSARVAWCRRVDLEAYEVGVQFDEPIEVFRFLDPDDPDTVRPA